MATLLENHQTTAVLCAIATAFMASLVLAFDVSERALLHTTLKMKFVDLARDIGTIGWQSLTHAQLAAFQAQRANIERNEPPLLHYLNIACHNELCVADGLGRSEQYTLAWWQRYFAHLIYGSTSLFVPSA